MMRPLLKPSELADRILSQISDVPASEQPAVTEETKPASNSNALLKPNFKRPILRPSPVICAVNETTGPTTKSVVAEETSSEATREVASSNGDQVEDIKNVEVSASESTGLEQTQLEQIHVEQLHVEQIPIEQTAAEAILDIGLPDELGTGHDSENVEAEIARIEEANSKEIQTRLQQTLHGSSSPVDQHHLPSQPAYPSVGTKIPRQTRTVSGQPLPMHSSHSQSSQKGGGNQQPASAECAFLQSECINLQGQLAEAESRCERLRASVDQKTRIIRKLEKEKADIIRERTEKLKSEDERIASSTMAGAVGGSTSGTPKPSRKAPVPITMSSKSSSAASSTGTVSAVDKKEIENLKQELEKIKKDNNTIRASHAQERASLRSQIARLKKEKQEKELQWKAEKVELVNEKAAAEKAAAEKAAAEKAAGEKDSAVKSSAMKPASTKSQAAEKRFSVGNAKSSFDSPLRKAQEMFDLIQTSSSKFGTDAAITDTMISDTVKTNAPISNAANTNAMITEAIINSTKAVKPFEVERPVQDVNHCEGNHQKDVNHFEGNHQRYNNHSYTYSELESLSIAADSESLMGQEDGHEEEQEGNSVLEGNSILEGQSILEERSVCIEERSVCIEERSVCIEEDGQSLLVEEEDFLSEEPSILSMERCDV